MKFVGWLMTAPPKWGLAKIIEIIESYWILLDCSSPPKMIPSYFEQQHKSLNFIETHWKSLDLYYPQNGAPKHNWNSLKLISAQKCENVARSPALVSASHRLQARICGLQHLDVRCSGQKSHQVDIKDVQRATFLYSARLCDEKCMSPVVSLSLAAHAQLLDGDVYASPPACLA